MQTVKSGGPQGSVLGPDLFLLFVNDMPLFITEAYVDIYADDTTVHNSSKDTKVIKSKLQVSSKDFKHYCIKNNMYVHLGKTFFYAYRLPSKYFLTLSESIQIYVDNELIRDVENRKLLVITIDKHLTWDQQIDIVSLNINRRITLLKLLSKYVGKQSLNQYYNSYILPIFDFGCMIW